MGVNREVAEVTSGLGNEKDQYDANHPKVFDANRPAAIRRRVRHRPPSPLRSQVLPCSNVLAVEPVKHVSSKKKNQLNPTRLFGVKPVSAGPGNNSELCGMSSSLQR